jgi:hypothetical protein
MAVIQVQNLMKERLEHARWWVRGVHVVLHDVLYEPRYGIVGPGDGRKGQSEVDGWDGRCGAM